MLTRTLNLPAPLFLVPTPALDGILSRLRLAHPQLPGSVEELAADLAARGAVPATFPRRSSRGQALALHGQGWTALLNPSPDGRSYQVPAVTPLRFVDHERMARGCLLLRPTAWTVQPAPVPEHARIYWDFLTDEWDRLRSEAAVEKAPGPDEREARQLALLAKAVDAEHELGRQRAAAERPFVYRDVSPGTDSCTFVLVGGLRFPAEGDALRVRGEPALRGRVTSVDRRRARVTLTYERPVERQRLPEQGELERYEDGTAYARRSDALTALRDGHTRNPHLLPILAGTCRLDRNMLRAGGGGAFGAAVSDTSWTSGVGTFGAPNADRTGPLGIPAPRLPDPSAAPVPQSAPPEENPLDDSQRAALHAALSTPALATITGPPGTGKTRVLTELVRATTRTGTRVLVTAGTEPAVDDILTRLPPDLVTLRVGSERRVAPAARHLLLDRRAAELRQDVLDRAAARLSAHPAGGPRTDHWPRALYDAVSALECAVRRERSARDALDEARRGVAGPAQVRLDRVAERLHRTLDRQARTTERLERMRQCRPLSMWWHGRQLARTEKALRVYDEAIEQAGRDRAAAEVALDIATRDHPAVRERRAAAERAVQEVARCREDARFAERSCRALLAPVGHAPADLHTFARWARTAHPLLAARRSLLAEWRDDVRAEAGRLGAELLRYAHVVGATDVEGPLTGVEFDLAVVDDAGQVTTADALVPLVRARRAVLAGEEMEGHGDQPGDDEAHLASRSILGLLQERLPDSAVTRLHTQHRMPREIADFCARVLCEGWTGAPGAGGADGSQLAVSDGLFSSPLVLVDTSDRSVGERVEGELIAALVRRCVKAGEEWAVVVPGHAQVGLVRGMLKGLSAGRGDVSTVDSFHGGERDVVLCGFTPGDPLGELRRFQRAFTRARRRLVLFGDFRESAAQYAAEEGESLTAGELAARLGLEGSGS